MDQQSVSGEAFTTRKTSNPSSTIQSRADEVLVAIAVLGLIASVADGQADYREIETFTSEFRKRFALSRRHSLKLIGAALKRITLAGQTNIIDCSCDTLREHLDSSQKVKLFEGLAEVLIADGKVHEGEEHFLDYVAHKLNIAHELKKKYASL